MEGGIVCICNICNDYLIKAYKPFRQEEDPFSGIGRSWRVVSIFLSPGFSPFTKPNICRDVPFIILPIYI
jgi:hypothetical protein